MISQKLLEELHDIIKDEYGIDLTLAETSKIGNDLVSAFEILIKIDRAEKHNP